MIHLRPVTTADHTDILAVEAGSTPNLRYLGAVYQMFMTDPGGEFMLVEDAGQVLGCAKYTRQPDGSVWLEALRVRPETQGQGLGKRMYERFFELAREQGISTMRMYTGVTNHASRGLAERFGFSLEETFAGYTLANIPQQAGATAFAPVAAEQAADLLLPLRQSWGEFVVLNRTFYPLTPEFCHHLGKAGMVCTHGESVLVLGARFSPELALHVGLFAGDAAACLAFAGAEAQRRGVSKLHCLCASTKTQNRAALEAAGFSEDAGEYIVMKVTL